MSDYPVENPPNESQDSRNWRFLSELPWLLPEAVERVLAERLAAAQAKAQEGLSNVRPHLEALRKELQTEVRAEFRRRLPSVCRMPANSPRNCRGPCLPFIPGYDARAIFDGVEKGEEDIFPDPMSGSIADSWRNGVAKALERLFAACTPENVTKLV